MRDLNDVGTVVAGVCRFLDLVFESNEFPPVPAFEFFPLTAQTMFFRHIRYGPLGSSHHF